MSDIFIKPKNLQLKDDALLAKVKPNATIGEQEAQLLTPAGVLAYDDEVLAKTCIIDGKRYYTPFYKSKYKNVIDLHQMQKGDYAFGNTQAGFVARANGKITIQNKTKSLKTILENAINANISFIENVKAAKIQNSANGSQDPLAPQTISAIQSNITELQNVLTEISELFND